MGVTSSDGDSFGQFDVEETNIQKKENKASQARGFQPFPMHVHKPNGLVREVTDDADLADALAKGWYDDIRKVPTDAVTPAPERISAMTILQAAKAVAAATPEQLAAFEADERQHAGGRDAVLALIAEAKDAVSTATTPAKGKGKGKKE